MKLHVLLIPALCWLAGCSRPKHNTSGPDAPCAIPDTLRVGTLYSPTSFFIYRGDSLGIDYDMARALSRHLRRPMTLSTARSQARLIEMLEAGKIDVIAWPVPIIAEFAGKVTPCGYETVTQQALIQQCPPGEKPEITDVTQLPGKDVYVLAGSKYEARMHNLNSELGGGIRIHTLDPDSVAPEEIVDMVADGKIPLGVLDSDLAQLHGGYHANINSQVPLSLDQRAAWAVARGRTCLADSINSWAARSEPARQRAELLKQYYQLGKLASTTYGKIDFSDGTMSPAYDPIFRRYAPVINWDWRMLAAQAYTESRFNPKARSFAGARGLMQIMPRTGRSYGLRKPTDPEQSVRAAVSYIADLDKMFEQKVPDPEQRKKFVLASYNGGQGHIFDAMRLAEKHGLDPTVWDENVEKAVLMLANPTHYNDTVVKYGYLRGRETYNYVKQIMKLYNLGKTAIPV